MFETAIKGLVRNNPFRDVEISAVFENNGQTVEVAGFYDGDGLWRIRFMPNRLGAWTYKTRSNVPELSGSTGRFDCIAPSSHGPVSVADTFHFTYADGTPYRPFGTTSYAWTHQSDSQCALTLKTLAVSPFNKIRFAIFPNSDVGDNGLYPFPGSPKNWDFARFNPTYFQRFERFVAKLQTLNIEADVILFHPYDHGKFGFDAMPADVDARYVRYVVARLAAYRNVWWSLANEYDDIKTKTDANFDTLFEVVRESDPYAHLRSIHHNRTLYDYAKPWVTHASIQNGSAVIDDGRAVLYRDVWRKPVIFDEVKYEGNMAKRWGNLSGEELTRRFWEGTIAGTYVGHGESIEDADKHLFLGDGGLLRGSSPPRIGFLRKILEDGPRAINPIDKWQERHLGGVAGQYYLRYFGDATPTEWPFVLPKEGLSDGVRFKVDVLDTWGMTVTALPGEFTLYKSGDYDFTADRPVPLPGKPWIALRIRKV